MGHTTTEITGQVSVSDVMAVLGVADARIGYLCSNKHGKVNRFAKCKPYGTRKYQKLTEADRKALNYGMTPQRLQIGYLEQDCKATPWSQWTPPAGGEAYPYRLGDFQGYKHDAVPFVKSVEIYSTAGKQYTVPIYGNQNTIMSGGMNGSVSVNPLADLTLLDFTIDGTALGDMYLTLVITPQDTGGDTFFVAQNEQKLSDALMTNDIHVGMTTTDIQNLYSALGNSSFVFLGLSPRKYVIDSQYKAYGFTAASLRELVSLDMWNDATNIRQIVYNNCPAVAAGSGGAGGTPQTITYRIQGDIDSYPSNAGIDGNYYEGYRLNIYGSMLHVQFTPSDDLTQAMMLQQKTVKVYVDVQIPELGYSDTITVEANDGRDPYTYNLFELQGFDAGVGIYADFMYPLQFNSNGIEYGRSYQAQMRMRVITEAGGGYVISLTRTSGGTVSTPWIGFDALFY